MAENTKIEWCDYTFNPWVGCTKVAPGCAHCYAESFSKRFNKAAWGPSGTRVKTSDANWKKPLKWEREAVQFEHWKNWHRPRVFCASLADVFEDWRGQVQNSKGVYLSTVQGAREVITTMTDVRRDLFRLIDATPHLDWLLLTKRPENIWRMWEPTESRPLPNRPVNLRESPHPQFRPNVWLGTSVATQADANANIPALLKCRDLCPVLFVSYEPALEAITFDTGGRGGPPRFLSVEVDHNEDAMLDWLIFGGESGPGARPCSIEWARSTVRQCKEAGVAVFVKQLGAKVGGIRHPKGGDPSEWPEDLRVREFPKEGA